MTGPDRAHPKSLIDDIKNVFDTTPETEEGVGPTLGQDVGPERQRERDKRYGARDTDRPAKPRR